MKKNKKYPFSITITVVLLVLTACTAYYFLSDRYTFISQKSNIEHYISAKTSAKNVSSEQHCSYSHQKYSKGALGCDIDYMFSLSQNNQADEDPYKIANKLKWAYKFDNTASVNEYGEEKYLRHYVFEVDGLTCSYSLNKQGSKIEIGCSGPARAEWFPVRGN